MGAWDHTETLRWRLLVMTLRRGGATLEEAVDTANILFGLRRDAEDGPPLPPTAEEDDRAPRRRLDTKPS